VLGRIVAAVVHPPVVKAGGQRQILGSGQVLYAVHLSEVPQFQSLVFAIGRHVSFIASRVDVRDALAVADETANGRVAVHDPAVPNFDDPVVRACEQDVRIAPVCKSHRIDVVPVRIGDITDLLVLVQVVHDDLRGVRHADQLAAVSGELATEDSKERAVSVLV